MDNLIPTSPTCLNKSIHNTRLQRKRKRQQNAVDPSTSAEAINFYRNSSEEDSSDNEANFSSATSAQPSSNIIPDYKPFLEEIKLCIADRVPMEAKTKPAFSLTQKFLTCQDIFEEELAEDKQQLLNKENEKFDANLQTNASLITESELMKCWDQYDDILVDKSKLEKSVADKILEDFELSPLAVSQNPNCSYFSELTPEFRMKRKPEKSYSRRKRERVCMRLDLESTGKQQKQDNINTSPNSSQQLCNNLLNMTTGNGNDNLDEDVMPTSQIIPDLIQDILSLHTQSESKDSFSSSEDFQGFNNNNKSLENNEKYDNIFDETLLNAATLMDEAESNRTPTHEVSEHSRQELENDDVKTKSKDSLVSSNFDDDWNEDDQDFFASFNMQEIIEQQSKLDTFVSNKDANSTQAQTFKIPKLLDIVPPHEDVKFVGFKTAAAKNILVSKEAQMKVAKMMENLSEIPKIGNGKNCDINKDPNASIFDQDDTDWSNDCDFLLNFKTQDYLNNANNKLSKKSSQKLAENFGIQTANGKSIKISAKAQETAQKLLKDFQLDCGTNVEQQLSEMKTKIYTKLHDDKPTTSKAGNATNMDKVQQENVAETMEKELLNLKTEIYTQSKSNEPSTSKSAKVLNMQFQSEIESKPLLTEICQKPHDHFTKTSIGFQTANGKTLQASAKAQRAVQGFLQEFQNLPEDENFAQSLNQMKTKIFAKTHKSTKMSETCSKKALSSSEENEYSNMVLSEWPLGAIDQTESSSTLPKVKTMDECSNANVFEEFKNLPEDDNFAESLSQMKTKIFVKAHKSAKISEKCVKKALSSSEGNEYSNMILSEWPLGAIEQTQASCTLPQVQTMDERNNANMDTQSNADGTKFQAENQSFKAPGDPRKTAFNGFQTANGKTLQASAKAQKAVQSFFEEFQNLPEDDNFAESLSQMKTKIFVKAHKSANISEKGVKKALSSSEENEYSNMILSEWPLGAIEQTQACSTLPQVQTMDERSNANADTQSNAADKKFPTENQSFKAPLSPIKSAFSGFQTANGKTLQASAKAQRAVQSLLQEFQNLPEDENFAESLSQIKSKIFAKAHKSTNMPEKCAAKKLCSPEENDYSNLVFSEWPIESTNSAVANAEVKQDDSCSKFKKTVSQFESVEHEDKEFNKADSVSTGTSQNCINANSNQIVLTSKAKDFVISNNNNDKCNVTEKELPSINESPAQCSNATSKRKLSVEDDNNDTPAQSSKIPAVISSRTSFKEISIVGSPLNTEASCSSIISRKNLLTLSKNKRKGKNSFQQANSFNAKTNKISLNSAESLIETPNKPQGVNSLLACKQTPGTPNLKEFFSNAPDTSTPVPQAALKSRLAIADNDFKPISWEKSCNETTKANTSCNTSNHNQSYNASPASSHRITAKERLARLEMYGDAPSLSPILLNKSTETRRTVGLRRTRSMFKKKSDN